MQGRIHSTESFGSVDGPGVRFLIFMQGCAMRCRYCHNADTWDTKGGALMSADELLGKAERYSAYWGKIGGITVSGGEPLVRNELVGHYRKAGDRDKAFAHAERALALVDELELAGSVSAGTTYVNAATANSAFGEHQRALELFEKAKQRKINTCIDTAGQPFRRTEPFFSKFGRLCELTDLFLVDIKHIDPAEHKALTGAGNENILDMLRFLSDIGKPVWIRHVLVPGITDNDRYLRQTRAFLETLTNIQRAEVLPYHSMGAYKWEKLGLDYTLTDTQPPSAERIQNAKEILNGLKLTEE